MPACDGAAPHSRWSVSLRTCVYDQISLCDSVGQQTCNIGWWGDGPMPEGRQALEDSGQSYFIGKPVVVDEGEGWQTVFELEECGGHFKDAGLQAGDLILSICDIQISKGLLIGLPRLKSGPLTVEFIRPGKGLATIEIGQ